MNAGKSTQLLQVAHNYRQKGLKVLICKPMVDTKGQDTVVSRLGISQKVDILIPEEYLLSNGIARGIIDLILIDESQFLSKEQVDDLLWISSELKVNIICYGLRTDYLGRGFKGSTRLLEVADKIEELETICSCGKKATFNLLEYKGNIIKSPFFNQILIDDRPGDIIYREVCPGCYKLKNNF